MPCGSKPGAWVVRRDNELQYTKSYARRSPLSRGVEMEGSRLYEAARSSGFLTNQAWGNVIENGRGGVAATATAELGPCSGTGLEEMEELGREDVLPGFVCK